MCHQNRRMTNRERQIRDNLEKLVMQLVERGDQLLDLLHLRDAR